MDFELVIKKMGVFLIVKGMTDHFLVPTKKGVRAWQKQEQFRKP